MNSYEKFERLRDVLRKGEFANGLHDRNMLPAYGLQICRSDTAVPTVGTDDFFLLEFKELR
jgi:hypothetical protein